MSPAITINRPREEVERRWAEHEHPEHLRGADVSFRDAPGDRGTEIHVDLDEDSGGGPLRAVVEKVTGGQPALAQVKDDLRRFKQVIETGEVARSDATPEGEAAERKLKQRPAQAPEDGE